MKFVAFDSPIGQEQFRFPRSKKKRIRNKWAKQQKNFRNTFLKELRFDVVSGTVFGTSAMIAKLKAELEKIQPSHFSWMSFT